MIEKNINTNLIFIMGPTASGKSALALELAQKYDGEIVSADSMQLYKELDIGTAKPSQKEQELIKHHLIDVLDISEKSDVFNFLSMAQLAIKNIHAKNKCAIVAGGTGFYLKSLLYGLDQLPADATLRESLELQYAGDDGFIELKNYMQKNDSLAFEKYFNYHRKLIRALEVKIITGKSIIELQKNNSKQLQYSNFESYRIEHDNEILKSRIKKRCEIMLENGWIDEAKIMLAKGLLQTPSAWQAIGYSQINDYLNNQLNFSQLVERISTVTWQFARRQNTWFRHQHPETKVLCLK